MLPFLAAAGSSTGTAHTSQHATAQAFPKKKLLHRVGLMGGKVAVVPRRARI